MGRRAPPSDGSRHPADAQTAGRQIKESPCNGAVLPVPKPVRRPPALTKRDRRACARLSPFHVDRIFKSPYDRNWKRNRKSVEKGGLGRGSLHGRRFLPQPVQVSHAKRLPSLCAAGAAGREAGAGCALRRPAGRSVLSREFPTDRRTTWNTTNRTKNWFPPTI